MDARGALLMERIRSAVCAPGADSVYEELGSGETPAQGSSWKNGTADRPAPTCPTDSPRHGNSIPNRVAAEARYPHARIFWRGDGGCAAVLKMGAAWARSGRTVMCSGRALPNNLFCGRHDHLNLLFGEGAEEFLDRAFGRAARRPGRSLRFAEYELSAMEKALGEFWGAVS